MFRIQAFYFLQTLGL